MDYNSYSPSIAGLYKIIDGFVLIFEGLFTLIKALYRFVWGNKHYAGMVIASCLFVAMLIAYAWIFVALW